MNGPESLGPSPEEEGRKEEDEISEWKEVSPEEVATAEKYFQEVLEEYRRRGEKPPGFIKWPPGAERPRLIKEIEEEENA